MSHDAQAEGARKSNTPWRGDNRMLIGSQRTARDNARAQSQALKRMSLLERETGHDEEWWDNFHASQRARVWARIERDAA